MYARPISPPLRGLNQCSLIDDRTSPWQVRVKPEVLYSIREPWKPGPPSRMLRKVRKARGLVTEYITSSRYQHTIPSFFDLLSLLSFTRAPTRIAKPPNAAPQINPYQNQRTQPSLPLIHTSGRQKLLQPFHQRLRIA